MFHALLLKQTETMVGEMVELHVTKKSSIWTKIQLHTKYHQNPVAVNKR